MLPAVEELAIDFYEHDMPPEWRNEVDSTTWYDLLRPFKYVKKLRVGHALTLDLSRTLQPDEEQLGTGGGILEGPLFLLLPVMQELVLEEGCDDNAFTAFIDARQRVGCPIQLVIRPSSRDPELHAKVKVTDIPFGPGVITNLATELPSGLIIAPQQKTVVRTPPKPKRHWYQKYFNVIKNTLRQGSS